MNLKKNFIPIVGGVLIIVIVIAFSLMRSQNNIFHSASKPSVQSNPSPPPQSSPKNVEANQKLCENQLKKFSKEFLMAKNEKDIAQLEAVKDEIDSFSQQCINYLLIYNQLVKLSQLCEKEIEKLKYKNCNQKFDRIVSQTVETNIDEVYNAIQQLDELLSECTSSSIIWKIKNKKEAYLKKLHRLCKNRVNQLRDEFKSAKHWWNDDEDKIREVLRKAQNLRQKCYLLEDVEGEISRLINDCKSEL